MNQRRKLTHILSSLPLSVSSKFKTLRPDQNRVHQIRIHQTHAVAAILLSSPSNSTWSSSSTESRVWIPITPTAISAPWGRDPSSRSNGEDPERWLSNAPSSGVTQRKANQKTERGRRKQHVSFKIRLLFFQFRRRIFTYYIFLIYFNSLLH